MNAAKTGDYRENGSVGAAGEEKQKLEALTESSGLESTTENKENGDLKLESLTSTTPFEAKLKPIKSLPLLDSLYPNGQPRFKLIREWSNGRLRIFSVPVPMVEGQRPEWRRVLQCRREESEDGKIKISWIGGQVMSESMYRPMIPTDQRQ
ncbi:hypothetical protein SLE2022_206710 [Rubroshorea leprosula]